MRPSAIVLWNRDQVPIATRAQFESIAPLRRRFLAEAGFQIRYEVCHIRGWVDYHLITIHGEPVGYGAIKGEKTEARDTIFEFYLVPEKRHLARECFRSLIAASRPSSIECQSNDFGLFSMLCRFAPSFSASVILFAAAETTELKHPGAAFRRRRAEDKIFTHHTEPVGDWVLECAGQVVATGGYLTHYNRPFADLYVETASAWRRKGLASFLLQEIQKQCRAAGFVPAARCDIDNEASMKALCRAGLNVCGFLLSGSL